MENAKTAGEKVELILLRFAQITIGLAIFITISGFFSCMTADGHAVIGRDPVSLEAQQAVIIDQTITYGLTLLCLSLIAVVARFVIRRR